MREAFVKFTGLFALDLADQHERQFCKRWLTHRHENIARIFLYLMAAFHVSGVLQCLTNPWVNLPSFLLYHKVGLAAAVMIVGLGRLKPRWIRLLALGLGTLNTLGYLVAIHHQDFASMQVVVVTAIVLSVGVLGFMCFFPGNSKELFAISLVIGAGIVFAYARVLDISFVVLELLTIMFFGWVSHFLMMRRELVHGRLEFRTRLRMAPAQIVRQSKNFGEELTLGFENASRLCVCISSDWRGYQALSGQMTSDALAVTMQKYYELADRLLRESFPAGNYFTDWIADELFVVVFAASEDDSSNLANAALRFGQKLLAAKAEFAATTDLPISIDVGLSRGSAFIGLLGPDSHRKATALGEIPGRARRLQGVGNLLRVQCGPADRVIFGVDVLSALFLPVDVKSFKAEHGFRDLKDDEVFYVEDTWAVESLQPRRLKETA